MIYVHNILLTCLRTFVRSIFLCFVTWHGHSPWHLHDKSPQNTHYSDVCNTFSHRIKKYFRLLTICHPPPASTHVANSSFSQAQKVHMSLICLFLTKCFHGCLHVGGHCVRPGPSRVHYASVNRSMSSQGNSVVISTWSWHKSWQSINWSQRYNHVILGLIESQLNTSITKNWNVQKFSNLDLEYLLLLLANANALWLLRML